MTVNVDTPENTGDASNTSPRQQLAPTQKADAKHQAEPSNWLARAQTIAHWLWRSIPAWAKRWDFALVLALGALLRLLWLDDTAFLGDQAQLLSVARSAVDHSSFIFTGIPSSIGSLNPPFTVWVLAPFAWLGDPIWATLETALANIAALVLLYALTNRYMGRRAAFAAGLLYATASGSVTYARFIWQQNLLAPFLLLFIWTICWGLIERRPGWLGWNLLFWGAAVELHTTAAPLLALTAVTVLLTRKTTVRWRDAIFGAVALAILIAPTLLWQLINQGSDITAFRAYGMRTPLIDGKPVSLLLELLTPPDPFSYSNFYYATPYFAWIAWLGPLLLLIFIAAQVWLCISIVSRVPVLQMLRRAPGWRSALQATLANRRWLFLLVAALWQDAPILFLVRHNAIYEHYLLVALPVMFLVIGLFLTEVSRWIARWAPVGATKLTKRLHTGLTEQLRRMLTRQSGARRAGLASLALILALLAGAQTYDVLAQLTMLHQGAFNGAVNPAGMPLDAQRVMLREASDAASQAHLPLYIAAPYSMQMPLGYLSASGYANDAANAGGAATVYDAENCVLLPAQGTNAQPIATLALPSVTATTVLQRSPQAHLLRTLSVASLPLYVVSPGAYASDEIPLTSANATSGADVGAASPLTTLTPTTYALDGNVTGRLSLFVRWSGFPTPLTSYGKDMSYWFGAQPGDASQAYADYWFYAQPFDAQGQAIRAPMTGLCPTLVWPRGMDMMTWIRLPLGFNESAVASWRIWIAGQSVNAHRPSLGPIALETGDLRVSPLTPLSGYTTIRVR